jgi:hypothetical protein
MNNPSVPNANVTAKPGTNLLANVIAHPTYLKVRLFGARPDSRYVGDAKETLPLGPDLLQDISALYQS